MLQSPELPYLAGCYRHSGSPFVRGEGCWLEDEEGRRFLDMGSGVAVSALGHGHPQLIQAISEQAQKLLHISNLYRNPAVMGAASRIAEASGFPRVFLSNSGAEAIEAALKLARRWFQVVRGEDRSDFVCAEHSFHGRTFGALSATGQPKYHKGFEPIVPEVYYADYGDLASVEAALAGAEGRISTLSFGDYKIPTSADVPQMETILIEDEEGPAPYESKGIGESSNIPIAGAIANAVYDAVGVRITDLPITADKVLAGLRAKGG